LFTPPNGARRFPGTNAMVMHRPICPDGTAAMRQAPPAGAAPCAEASRPWVLAATILASAMAFIDGSVVTIALPVLQAELGAGLAALQWVVNGYTLFLGSLILVGGAAGDRFGRRRLFLIGTVVFAVASAACALAPGAGALIAARAVQGVGAALMVPQSLAILSAAFPVELRGRAIGTWAGASAITTALGPAVGGLLIDSFGWRAAFWINLPLALAVVAVARAHVPESRAPAPGPLDWGGGALAVAAAALLTLGLTALAEPGQGGLAAAGLVAGGAALAVSFLAVERRAAAPLVPLSLFASRAFSGANLLTLFLYGALSGVLFLLPFELMGRRGLSAAEVGLVLLPLGLIIGLFARPAGGLADRLGTRPFLGAGSALVALSAAWLALTPPGLALGVVAPLVVLAAGMALVVAPLTTAVMNAAPDALAGAASGINNAASRLAGLFAIALVGAVAAIVFAGTADTAGARFGVFPPPGAPGHDAVAAAFDRAYRAGMAACAAMAAAAAATAWIALRPERPRPARA
jgi:EmrB/QacA subfamily drug resistance transporter